MPLCIRHSLLPLIFTRFDWVRVQHCGFMDCVSEEDQGLIQKCKEVLNLKKDIAELDSHSLFLAADIPDTINEATGQSRQPYSLKIYTWKLADVEYLLKGIRPAEAIEIRRIGLSSDDLLHLASNTRYLSFIRDYEKGSLQSEGHYFPLSLEKKLRVIEDQTAAQVSFRKKLLALKRTPGPRISSSPQVTEKIRNKVLQYHNYACIFDGKTRPDFAIHVHHVIPRKLIERLHLPESLFTARENLVASCSGCNITKSDELNPKDIAFYISQFSSLEHPNNALVSYLRKIQELQRQI